MTITTILAFGVGITAGFVAGVFASERLNVSTQSLTDLSGQAISRVRSTYQSLTKNEKASRQAPIYGQN